MEGRRIRVSILICTRNRENALRQTLASLAELEVPAVIEPELIVVDNGSTDGTAAYVRSFTLPNMPVRLVQEPRAGAGRARNAALRAATGDILLFTDDDLRLDRKWIGAMCKPILTGQAQAVAGKVVLASHLQRPWMEPVHRVILASTEGMNPEEPQDMFGASMGLARVVLDRVPAFDPELGPGTRIGGLEDTLFAWQLKEAGFKVAFVSDAVAEHHLEPSRLTRAAFLAAARRFGRARGYIAYHWEHVPYAASPRIPSPLLTLALRYCRLALWRSVHWNEWRRHEGISPWEFGMVRHIEATRQYIAERGRRPNYEHRGLVKERGDVNF